MKAIYTCLTTTGNKVKVETSSNKTIEDIKALAAETHKQVVVDVINEELFGDPNLDDDDE